MRPIVVLLILTSAILGCGPDFDPGSLITKPRLLAAKVIVADDLESASPAPGQEITIKWLTVDPMSTTASFEWAFGACVAAPTLSGGQLCQQSPFGFAQGSGSTPTYALTVPEQAVLAGSNELLVAGVVCGRGSLVFDQGGGVEDLQGNPNVFSQLEKLVQCVGDDRERMLVSLVVSLRSGTPSNLHPDLSVVPMTIDDKPWPQTDPNLDPTKGCTELASEAGVPSITRDHKHVIIQQYLNGGERDFYQSSDAPGALVRELLQLSQFTTAGELDRQFTVIEADASDQVLVEIKWQLPDSEELTATDFLVHFYFVGRDLRGGSDWTLRSICIPSMLQ